MKKLLSTLRLGMALFLAAFSTNLLPVATANATTGGPNEDCDAGLTLIAKYEWNNNTYVYEKGLSSTAVTVSGNAESGTFTVASGYNVSQVIVKGGQGTTGGTTNGTSGSFSNVGLPEAGNSGKPADISNLQFCGNIVVPKDATAGVTVTPPTCESAGVASVSGVANATLSAPLVQTPGTHQAVFSATAGHQFADGNTTLTVSYTILPMLTGERCVLSQISVTPTPPTVKDVCGSSADAITLPANTSDITYSLNGNVVTATLVSPSTTDFSATLNGYVVAENGNTATFTVPAFTNYPCVDVCPAQIDNIHSTNLDKNGWTVPAEAEYVEGGIELNVSGNWDSTSITRSFSGTLADLGSAVDIDADPLQYVGIHVVTSLGTLTYEEELSYGGKWWSNSDFGVASGMGYTTFDTLENIARANPDLAVTSFYVLYTHPSASSTVVTSVTIGCVEYTFDKEGCGCNGDNVVAPVPPTPVQPTCEDPYGYLIGFVTDERYGYTDDVADVALGGPYPAGSEVTVTALAKGNYTFGQNAYTWDFSFDEAPTEEECDGGGGGTTDVCPNLDGNQATVPDGYVKVGDECGKVQGETDVCPNLPGPQAEVPAGYVKSGEDCVAGGVGGGDILGVSAPLPAELPATGADSRFNPLLVILAALAAYGATYFWQGRQLRRTEETA